MATSSSVLLSFALFVLCCSSSTLLLSDAAAAAQPNLPDEICRNTTDYGFCMYVINQDPHPGADTLLLATLIIQQGIRNATNTVDFIVSQLKAGGADPGTVDGLKKCQGHYQIAVRTLQDMYNYIDTDEPPYIKKLTPSLEASVSHCEASVPKQSVLTKNNQDMSKFANIVTVISNLV